MYELAFFWELTRQALLLREHAFHVIQALASGSSLALVIVLLAGLSTAVGQSVVLFVNRVKPRRFVVSLLVSSSLYVFVYLFWALSIWLVGRYLLGSEQSLARVARAVGLGYAPQLFNFLAFMPYFGGPVGALLSLWSLLAILVGVQMAFEVTLWQALLASGAGWLVLQALQRTVGRPLMMLSRWLQRRAAGVELITDKEKLAELLDLKHLNVPETERESKAP